MLSISIYAFPKDTKRLLPGRDATNANRRWQYSSNGADLKGEGGMD